jgi:ribose-phosphate pyrophosphokinase
MDGVVLLADPKSSAWKFAEKIKNYLDSQYSDNVPLRELSLTQFRSREIHPYVPENIRKKEVYFIHDSTKDPQYWLAELIFNKDLLLRASVEKLIFVLPNLLYSRQDRKDKSRVSIHAKAVADVISPGLSRIITMDLHADQIQGFYPQTCPLDSLHSFREVSKYLESHPLCDLENLVVASPDVGGAKRAKSFSQKMGVKIQLL